jgi:hypothetical protein
LAGELGSASVIEPPISESSQAYSPLVSVVLVCTCTQLVFAGVWNVANALAPFDVNTCPLVPAVPDCTAPVDVVPPNSGAYAVNAVCPVPPLATATDPEFTSLPAIDLFVNVCVLEISATVPLGTAFVPHESIVDPFAIPYPAALVGVPLIFDHASPVIHDGFE